MAAFLAEGFVVQDDCRFSFLPTLVILEGLVICTDGITLDVRKEIAILDGRGPAATVQTRMYRYNAWLRGTHNILRYDSPHAHRQFHHKHLYDTFRTGRELDLLRIDDEDEIPTMADVLRELRSWCQAHASHLRYLR